MGGLVQDLRFTFRHLTKHRGLTLVIVLSVALGIGVNTAIFSLIHSVILEDLPVREPDRLVLLHWGADRWPNGMTQSGSSGAARSRADGVAWSSSSRSLPFPFFRGIAGDMTHLSSVFAFAPLGQSGQNVTLAAGGIAERVDGEMVSGAFFAGLGVTPAAGRLIAPEDEQSQSPVAVLSHGYWVSRFAADPAIVGSTVRINDLPYSVIGVARDGFSGVQPGRMPDVWIPMTDAPQIQPWGYRPAAVSLMEAHRYWWVHVMGRLQPGADRRTAEAELNAAFQRFVLEALPAVDRDHLPRLGFERGANGLDIVRGRYRRSLYLLMGMVTVVLLIACANVAVLLLSASTARGREFALRLSLGARRGRLVRQLLTESMALAAAGGLLGLLFASWTSRGLLYLLPAAQRPLIDHPIDGGVLIFAAAVTAATAVLFGLVPALVGTRVDLLPQLKQSGAASGDRPAHRVWSSALVVAQVGLSLVLIVGAALFVRTILHLSSQPLGVSTERLLVFGMDPSQNGYTGERLAGLYGDILERLRALPGVQAASGSRLRLFSGWRSSSPATVPGAPPGPEGTLLFSNAVAPDFHAALGVQLLTGRDLTWAEVAGERRVAVVNEAMVRTFFGGAAPVGRRFFFGTAPAPENEYEIVGVVSNAKYHRVDGEFPPTAYVPFTANRTSLGQLYMVLRTSGDPLALAPAVRDTVRGVDPDIAIVELGTMDEHVAESLWRERLMARLAGAFGMLALTLACVGLFGTLSYHVGRRRAEIALRMALGALRTQVLWMVLRRALVLAGAGILVGLPLTFWAGRLVSAQLAGVAPGDPVALLTGAVILLSVAALAGYLPARRAAGIEPAAALKQP